MSVKVIDSVYNAMKTMLNTSKQNIVIVGYERNLEVTSGMSLFYIPFDINGKHIEYLGWIDFLKQTHDKSYDFDNKLFVVVALSNMNDNNVVTTKTIKLKDTNLSLANVDCLLITVCSKPFQDMHMWNLFDCSMGNYLCNNYFVNGVQYEQTDEDFYITSD